MRNLLVLPGLLLTLSGCAALAAASARPTTVFPPLPDEEAQADNHDQATVTVLEHRVGLHAGCYAVQRTSGAGIIRCGPTGQVEWVVTETIAEGVDDFDTLKDAMKSDSDTSGSKLDLKDVDCTVGGAPGSCRVYGFHPKDGSPERTTIVGLAQLPGKSLVAQCVARAGQTDAMRPVCSEVFELK